ncbi:hypothetical protein BDP27DRAFT_1440309 [Rhodocollybia butyracea]|uniref:Tyr recombinase domain-containing protein n=1 Tax=Rhodocollybia butyracea TaxID=206335 RepID=A0A9P5TWC2_9AGAR|nr:hypothetical protein BDP27DRAFT_1440309 [Rhodocollybia butyracea]
MTNSPPSCLSLSEDAQPTSAVRTSRDNWRQLRPYLTWCSNRGLSASQSLPASEQLLSEYAASLACDVTKSTAACYLLAIEDWHVQNGFTHQDGNNLRSLSASVKPLLPPASGRITINKDHMIILHNGLDLSGRNGLHSCVAAAVQCLWAGQIRASELLNSSDIQNFTSCSYPTVSSLRVSNIDATRRLKLPQSQDEVVIPASSGVNATINANDALIDHICINRLEPQHPLFSYRDSRGSLQVLTRIRLMEVCHTVWEKHGSIPTTAYSFRIGGATHYLLAGVPPSTVKTLGRWNSDVFLKYWCDLESLTSVTALFTPDIATAPKSTNAPVHISNHP